MGQKKFRGVKKITENPFLNLYEIEAFLKSGKPFRYYFVSRDEEASIKLHTHSQKPTGMAVYAVTEELPHRLVMIRQYRYPVDEYLYELPAGIIEQGETPNEAAVREMKEETGLTFEPYEGGEDCLRKALYLVPGFSDELNGTVFGIVKGNISKKYLEDTEDIEVFFVDKDEAKRILREEKLTLRAGYLLLQFIKAAEERPFDFLEF
ncbi:MAG: NUDIX hydrolase [Roseburia sp.]